jgi:glutaredoxin-dependent peroxiredoxin
MEGFRANHDRFTALGASVLGLCVESDRAHTAFANQLGLPFPLLSDFNRQAIEQFGIAYTPEEPFGGFWGMSRRSVFVLDRDGVVRYAWVTDDPLVPPDVEEVLRAVEALPRT